MREMGIRIAIGATPSSFVPLMVRQTLTPIAVGLLAAYLPARRAGRVDSVAVLRAD